MQSSEQALGDHDIHDICYTYGYIGHYHPTLFAHVADTVKTVAPQLSTSTLANVLWCYGKLAPKDYAWLPTHIAPSLLMGVRQMKGSDLVRLA